MTEYIDIFASSQKHIQFFINSKPQSIPWIVNGAGQLKAKSIPLEVVGSWPR
jgi:hypothetical protein